MRRGAAIARSRKERIFLVRKKIFLRPKIGEGDQTPSGVEAVCWGSPDAWACSRFGLNRACGAVRLYCRVLQRVIHVKVAKGWSSGAFVPANLRSHFALAARITAANINFETRRWDEEEAPEALHHH